MENNLQIIYIVKDHKALTHFTQWSSCFLHKNKTLFTKETKTYHKCSKP